MIERREALIGVACALAVVVLWTGFVVLSRLATVTSFMPLDLAFVRFAVAGLAILPVAAIRGTTELRRAGWLKAFVLAATAGLGFTLISFIAFTKAPAAHGAALMPGALPLWTAILATLVLGEALGRLKLIGLACIVGGIAATAGHSMIAATPQQLTGDAMFIAASMTWAVFTIAARAWKVPPMDATVAIFGLSAAIYCPMYLMLAESGLGQVPWRDLIIQGVFQGILSTVVSIPLYTRALAAIGPAATTMITASVPAAVTLTAIPLLGEIPSALTWLGIALVSVGIVMTVTSLGMHRRVQTRA